MSSKILSSAAKGLSQGGQKPRRAQKDEAFYRAGQWQLVWWKFRRHKLAKIAMVVLGIFYFFAIFAEFVAPYDPLHRFKDYCRHAAHHDVHIRRCQRQLPPALCLRSPNAAVTR